MHSQLPETGHEAHHQFADINPKALSGGFSVHKVISFSARVKIGGGGTVMLTYKL